MKKDENNGVYRLRKGDFLAAAGILMAAVLIFVAFLPRGENAAVSAQVWLEGKLIATLPLDTSRELPVAGRYENIVTVQDGKVAITHSDCPSGDCVRCGWTDQPGKSIVCLPNALEIRIIGRASDVDFVVG